MNYEIIELAQGSALWHEHRNKYINASEVPIIFGISPYSTPRKLYNEKMGLEASQFENDNMRFGKQKEEEIRAKVNEVNGYEFKPLVAISKLHPHLSASLDGWDSEYKLILEIKCNNKINHGIAMKGEVPKIHMHQLQTQMLVMDINFLMYVSHWMDDNVEIFVVKDDVICDEIVQKTKRFYDMLINFKYEELEEILM